MTRGLAWPDDVRARALALVVEHGQVTRAAQLLRDEMGDQAPPGRTIAGWVWALDPALHIEIATTKKEIAASRWTDIELLALDHIEADILAGKISGHELIVAAGVGADKRLRRDEIEAKTGSRDTSGVRALLEKVERQMFGDGSEITTTQRVILEEGRMPSAPQDGG